MRYSVLSRFIISSAMDFSIVNNPSKDWICFCCRFTFSFNRWFSFDCILIFFLQRRKLLRIVFGLIGMFSSISPGYLTFRFGVKALRISLICRIHLKEISFNLHLSMNYIERYICINRRIFNSRRYNIITSDEILYCFFRFLQWNITNQRRIITRNFMSLTSRIHFKYANRFTYTCPLTSLKGTFVLIDELLTASIHEIRFVHWNITIPTAGIIPYPSETWQNIFENLLWKICFAFSYEWKPIFLLFPWL